MSGGYLLRLSAAEDELPLKALWKQVFQDEEQLIEAFFDCLYAPGRAVMLWQDGLLASAAYLLPDIALVAPDGKRTPAAYFYALTTRPDCRGRGFGKAVTAACADLAAERGEVMCLMPASASLRDWYMSDCGLYNFASAREIIYTAADDAVVPAPELCPISPEAYCVQRENLLAGTAHAALPGAFYRFQEKLCAYSGGALLSIRAADGRQGLACVEKSGDALFLPELLFDEVPAALAAITARYSAVQSRALLPGTELVTLMSDAEGLQKSAFWWGPYFG